MPLIKRKQHDEDGLSPIGEALDAISWQWLNDNHWELAAAVEQAVDDGATPEQVRRYVMYRAERYELALRCEQAARYLMSQ